MPELDFNREFIAQMRVVDRQQDDTVICQVGTLRGFQCVQNAANRVMSATIDVWVTEHSLRNGEPGAQLPGNVARPVSFTADNSTLVDAATGQELAKRTTENDKQWQAIKDSYAQQVLGQGDFYLRMLLAGPVSLPALILYHMQRANSPELNRYAYTS